MKTCKKILCSLLVVVMCLTSAPLQGFVGIDWPEWSFLANAEDISDYLPDDAIDYSNLTANEYMTRVLLDYDYYGSANDWKRGYGTIQKEQVGYYFNREKISLAYAMVRSLESNKTFMTSVNAWEVLTFDPATFTEDMLSERDYYMSILLSILDVEMEESAFMEALSNSTNESIIALSDGTSKFLDGLGLGTDTKKVSLSSLSSSQAEQLKETVKNSDKVKGLYSYLGDYVEGIDALYKGCTTVYDFVKGISSYDSLVEYNKSIKDVLYVIYQNCPSSNIPMKQAALEVYKLCSSELDKAIYSLLEAGTKIYSMAFSKVVGSLWDSCMTGLAGSFLVGVKIGQLVGTTISNFLSGTDGIIKGYYAMRALTKFEPVVIASIKACESAYKLNETPQNADNYIQALRLLMSTYELGNNYTYNFVYQSKNAGLINTVASWFRDDETVDSMRDSANVINNCLDFIRNFCLNLEGYRWDYEYDAPAAYKAYFEPEILTPVYEDDVEPEYIKPFKVEETKTAVLYTYKLKKDGTITITGCNKSSKGTLEIPSKIGGRLVTSIEPNAFKGCYGITEVKLSSGLQTIGYQAFSGTSITSVTIPKTVTSMGKKDYGSAFKGIDTLKTVTFEFGMLEIPSYALSGAASVNNVVLPEGLLKIGYYAFNNCTNLTTITIPSGVTEISSYAFYKCTKLATITMPSSIQTINEYAFYGCSSLSEVKLNEGLKTIKWGAFNNTALTSVTIPKTVTSMGIDDYNSPFAGISTLKTVIFEYGMSKIPSYALKGCSSVTSVSLPNGVTEIGSYAFYNCTGLTTITMPNSVQTIGKQALGKCTGLTTITTPSNLQTINEYAFSGCSSLSEVKLNEGLKTIKWGAFNGTALTSVTIPKTVTSMGTDDYNSPFASISTLKTVIFEYGMSKIPSYALKGCSSVTSVSIPSGVTEIASYAFYKCTGLTKITLPNSLQTIGNRAFAGCTELTVITMPNSLITIDSYAFSGCTKLNDVTLNNGLKTIRYDAFSNTALTTITIPSTVSALGNDDGSPFIGTSSLKNVIFEYGTTKIIGNALRKCTTVTNVVIPNTVTAINTNSFRGCTGIKELYIPASVTNINNYAFYGCSGLTDVYYVGSEEMWNKITIGSYNDPLKNATIHYNYNHSTHTYYPSVTKDALCLETGIMTYSCFCGSSYTETIPAKGHQMGEYVLVKPATCKEMGEEKSFCDLCGTFVSRDIDLADHTDNNSDKICDVCGESSVKVIDSGDFGEDGDNLHWVLYDDGELVISGTGRMEPEKVYNKFGGGMHISGLPDETYAEQVTSLVICEGVTHIGESMFAYCKNLSNVSLPSTLTEIGSYAFEDTAIINNINNYVNGVLYIDEYLIIVSEDAELTDFSIKPGTRVIADSAFINASSLDGTLTIPASLIYLGDNSIANVDKFVVDSKNTTYSNDSNSILYNKNKTVLIRCPEDTFRSYETFSILSTVVEIANSACRDCEFDEVIIPNSVEKIGRYAFEGCANLTYVDIPNSVKTIGDCAFRNSGLKSFTISNNIEKMGMNVFEYTPWYYAQPDGEIYADYIFCDYKGNINSVTELNIKPGTTVIAECVMGCYTQNDVHNPHPTVENLVLPESVKIIGEGAFSRLLELKTVSIPSTIEKIHGFNFEFCRNRNLEVYYNGTESLWKEVYIHLNNQRLKDATMHFEESPTDEHTPKTVTIPATCTVDGIEYVICEDCGETIGSPKILKATGHKSSDWIVEKEPTPYADGKKVKKCTVCSIVLEEAIIPKKATASDDGVIMEYAPGDYNGTVKLQVEESFDGSAFNLIDTQTGATQSLIYDIKMTVNGKEVQPVGNVTIKIPLPSGFKPDNCYIYYVNTSNGSVEKIATTYVGGYLVFETNHFSYYAIVDIHEHSYGDKDENCQDCGFDRTENCGCKCHKTGFITKLIWKITIFFNKLLRRNKVCPCGVYHY